MELPSSNLDNEAHKLVKLKLTEQNLAAMLQNLDKEINQTDVEWMHLRSLVESRNSLQSETESYQSKPSFVKQKVVKIEHHIDDKAINDIHLDLSLVNSGSHTKSFEREDDSD